LRARRPLADRRGRHLGSRLSRPLRLGDDTIGDDRHGEIAFGAFQASLDIKYGRESIGFTWEGWDEGDQVSGDGSAELLDDGSIEIEFAIHKGDEAVLKAIRADQGC